MLRGRGMATVYYSSSALATAQWPTGEVTRRTRPLVLQIPL